MSEEIDNTGEVEAAEEAQGPLAGERLRDARRDKEITVLEVAKELHLDEPKVRALERNEFDVLGAPVFAKGHLRKYAQLVGVDPDDVLLEYYEMNRAGPAPLVISPRSRARRELSPGPWIAVIVVIVVAAAAYWWFAARPVATEVTVEPAIESPAAEPDAGDVVTPEPDSEEPEAETAEPEAETAEPETPVAAEPTPNQVTMVVTYSGDCWTEISDAGGNRLYFNLGRAGRTINVTGEGPLNALFGDADNVSIEVNGSSRQIAAAERRGKTARVTIAP